MDQANCDNVFDRDSPDRYMNMPFSYSLESEVIFFITLVAILNYACCSTHQRVMVTFPYLVNPVLTLIQHNLEKSKVDKQISLLQFLSFTYR